MSTESPSASRPSEVVAPFLAALSIVGSALAIFYQPVKVAPFAVILALIATGMAPPRSRLPLFATAFAVIAFVVGMTVAVTAEHSLY
jgi:hypothetical protein